MSARSHAHIGVEQHHRGRGKGPVPEQRGRRRDSGAEAAPPRERLDKGDAVRRLAPEEVERRRDEAEGEERERLGGEAGGEKGREKRGKT